MIIKRRLIIIRKSFGYKNKEGIINISIHTYENTYRCIMRREEGSKYVSKEVVGLLVTGCWHLRHHIHTAAGADATAPATRVPELLLVSFF